MGMDFGADDGVDRGSGSEEGEEDGGGSEEREEDDSEDSENGSEAGFHGWQTKETTFAFGGETMR